MGNRTKKKDCRKVLCCTVTSSVTLANSIMDEKHRPVITSPNTKHTESTIFIRALEVVNPVRPSFHPFVLNYTLISVLK